MGFRKTKFQAWIVMENNIGHGKSWNVMEKPWKMIFLKEWSPCSHSVMARLPLRHSGHQTFMPHATTRGTAGFDNTYHQLNFKAETNGWVTPILLPLLPLSLYSLLPSLSPSGPLLCPEDSVVITRGKFFNFYIACYRILCYILIFCQLFRRKKIFGIVNYIFWVKCLEWVGDLPNWVGFCPAS